MAYAGDITIIIKNSKELNIVNEHLSLYKEISGSKLNHDKTEGVWFGRSEAKPIINIKDKDTMSILGIKFSRNDCYGENRNEKDKEIKEELDKWENKSCSYRAKILIIKTCVVSKLLFLATIFPPKDQTLKKINKMLVNFIWGNTREVTKRELLYKNKKTGGSELWTWG